MATRTFGDLLNRADKLSTTVNSYTRPPIGTQNQSFNWTKQQHGAEIVETKDISQIFNQAEQLWQKTRLQSDPAHVHGPHQDLRAPGGSRPQSGLVGPSFGPEDRLLSSTPTGAGDSNLVELLPSSRRPMMRSFMDRSPSAISSSENIFREDSSDLNTFLRNDREETLVSLIDETLNDAYEDAERAFEREQLKYFDQYKQELQSLVCSTSSPGGGGDSNTSFGMVRQHRERPSRRQHRLSQPVSRTPMNELEMVFAQQGYPELWTQVRFMLDSPYQSTSGHGLFGNVDGLCEGHPVWMVIYYCLRAGDVRGAQLICENSNAQEMRNFGGYLKEMANKETGRLSLGSETKVRMEYKRIGHTCGDPFKRAVLCWLSPCDSQYEFRELEAKLEDWLWGRLVQAAHWVRMDLAEEVDAPGEGTTSGSEQRIVASRRIVEHGQMRKGGDRYDLGCLQRKISEEYGEKHFQSGDSPLLYWTALWLTGQFEAAVEFLTRQSEALRCHAVHVALCLHETGLLLTPKDVKTPLSCVLNGDPAGVLRLNLCRLILMYTSKFQATDPREALNYLYFLRSFRNSSGENMFVASVTELVLKSKEYVMLLGKMEADGCRKPGLIDRFQLEPAGIIETVALECEKLGLKDNAVMLYDLAGVARKLRVVPLEAQEVDKFVSNFHMVPEEVRILLAEILISLMTALNEEYKKLKASTVGLPEKLGTKEVLEDMRKKAKALIMYAGLIPYRLPGDATGRLVHLELQLH